MAGKCAPTPSTQSSCALVKGERFGAAKVVGSWLGRSILIAPGLLLAGIRGRKVIYGSLAAAGMISLFLLAYTAATSADASPLRKRGSK